MKNRVREQAAFTLVKALEIVNNRKLKACHRRFVTGFYHAMNLRNQPMRDIIKNQMSEFWSDYG